MDQLKDEKSQCLLKLRNVITSLPEENYNLLRYVCHFLRELASNEASTKMSAANFGIVFGPCLFKCGLGVQVSIFAAFNLPHFICSLNCSYHIASLFKHHLTPSYLT